MNKTRFSTRKNNAGAAAKFAHVSDRNAAGHIRSIIVPGHEGRQYFVLFHYNQGEIVLECNIKTAIGLKPCKGSYTTVCYHMMAAIIAAAKETKKTVSFCNSQDAADRLNKLGGKTYRLVSKNNGQNNLCAVIK